MAQSCCAMLAVTCCSTMALSCLNKVQGNGACPRWFSAGLGSHAIAFTGIGLFQWATTVSRLASPDGPTLWLFGSQPSPKAPRSSTKRYTSLPLCPDHVARPGFFFIYALSPALSWSCPCLQPSPSSTLPALLTFPSLPSPPSSTQITIANRGPYHRLLAFVIVYIGQTLFLTPSFPGSRAAGIDRCMRKPIADWGYVTK
ncbi:hypothetical protein F4803DRAFT_121912 [Xylaria telfairii]|nr:hypothetical protein F4803DRAFT_121912 [Xylaria telfairii]